MARYWADLGQHWTVEENYIKPYPSCRWGHAAIDAVRKVMKDHGVTHDQVSHVEVRTFDEAARLFSGMPDSTTQAQYSMHFVVATMLRHGEVGPRHIEGPALSDPEVAAIIPRITAISDDRHNARFPEGRWSDVEVSLHDGRVLQSGDVPASGGPGAWLPDADVEEKFMSFCDGVLNENRSRAIWAMRDRLLQEDSTLSELTAMIVAGGDA